MEFNDIIKDKKSLTEQITRELPKIFECSDIKADILKFSENITVIIKEEQGKFILRLNRPNYHSKKEIESEMLFMKDIEEGTDILLPKALKFKNGEFVSDIEIFGNVLTCCCFSFVEGETIKSNSLFLNENLEKIGETAAKLHKLSQKKKFTYPRFAWDFDAMLGDVHRWGRWQDMKEISETRREILQAAEEFIKKFLDDYGKGSECYGLIHSDLHTSNFIANDREFVLIDFDDCGYGWYMYDIAAALSLYSDELEKKRDAVLRGYLKHREITQKDFAALNVLIAARRMTRLGWLNSREGNDVSKGVDLEEYIKKTVEIAKILIDG